MATTWELQYKESGEAWEYNQTNITYNEADYETGQIVKYNQMGSDTTWTLQAES